MCINEKCTLRLFIVKVNKNINEIKISSPHFSFESEGYKLSIPIIWAWTVECMPLHFWVLCRICSSYWRFSLYFKAWMGLENQIYVDICFLNDMISVLSFTYHDWCAFCIKLTVFYIINLRDPPLWIYNTASKQGE